MRITQGCFSFLPDLTTSRSTAQVEYCLDNGMGVGIEYTDDPHPRNTYWEMWGHPMFESTAPRRSRDCTCSAPMSKARAARNTPGTCAALTLKSPAGPHPAGPAAIVSRRP
jgi:hypothetical protein